MPTIDRIKPTPFHRLDPKEKLHRIRRASADSAARGKTEFNEANNIDPIPDVVDPHRREECKHSFKLHCETYNPNRFELQWSRDHIQLIQTMEDAVLRNTGLYAFACFRGFGKALDVNTPILTSDGWKTMLDIQVGDRVYDETGKLCNVLDAFEAMLNRPCYQVNFSDGTSVICDAEHLWTVNDRYRRLCSRTHVANRSDYTTTVTTEFIAKNVLMPHSRRDREETRFSIPCTKPLEYETKDYIISPYVLGVWLGDGTTENSNITSHVNDVGELVSNLQKEGERWITVIRDNRNENVCTIKLTPEIHNDSRSLRNRLKVLDLIGSKYIPDNYLRGSVEQRRALLQGLMDTDGCTDSKMGGRCEYVTKLSTLADGFAELLTGLGIKFRRSEKYVTCNGRKCGPYYRFCFSAVADDAVFRLNRKQSLLPNRNRTSIGMRFISSVTPVVSRPVKCIRVNSPSKLYLCGKDLIPTHNTTIAETLAQWALLHGHKQFIVCIAATSGHAKSLIESMWLDLETNELLLEDFPEVCYPIRLLERNMKRAIGQHLNNSPTMTYHKQDSFILPTIEGSISSGSKAQAAGITSSLRGLKHLLANGHVIRPDFVMIDDPQTDKSAKSDVMVAARERVINGAILGLSGPRKAMTAVMPCTVIRSNDLAERYLDKNKRPEWQGKRTKLLPSFPIHMELWRKYAEIRAEGLRAGMGQKEATEYYRANQSTMDEGAECSWVERFDPSLQISAIQSAMDIYFTNPTAFYSEYQNDPLKDAGDIGPHQLLLTFERLIQRCKKSAYRVVPRDTLYVTSGVDIQGKILYYLTVAWTSDFGGTIVDYGTYPKQDSYDGWTAQNPPIPLGYDNADIGLVPKVFAGLDRIKEDVFSQPFIRDEIGGNEYVNKCLIDANWALAADAVYAFCKQNESGNIYTPCHGRGVTATMVPMEQWNKKLGEKRYWNSRILPNTQDKNRGRHATYDGNAWKSVIAERLNVPLGSDNALGFYGDNPYNHQHLIEHLLVEKPVRKKGRGREVDEWESSAHMADNHWFDCLIQAAVAANILGLKPHVQTLIQSNVGQPDTTITAPAPEKVRRVASAPPVQRNPLDRGF